jgi:hypothetical protein
VGEARLTSARHVGTLAGVALAELCVEAAGVADIKETALGGLASQHAANAAMAAATATARSGRGCDLGDGRSTQHVDRIADDRFGDAVAVAHDRVGRACRSVAWANGRASWAYRGVPRAYGSVSRRNRSIRAEHEGVRGACRVLWAENYHIVAIDNGIYCT